ncbi:hypothetical protein ERJ75_001613400 [Trypanosoma vivax]|nr:hypothetical protein ERJ75_001614200 [Trypanosoma vivax]KAH8605734.1 hypothetical protein ERJ75_001613400 [Trypanosoma vivax]
MGRFGWREARGTESRTALNKARRAPCPALSSFAKASPKILRAFIGSIVAMNMAKGGAHSDVLVREPSLTDRALQEQGVWAPWDYIAPAEKPAEGIPSGNGLRKVDVAKGSAEGEVSNAFPLTPSLAMVFQSPSLVIIVFPVFCSVA